MDIKSISLSSPPQKSLEILLKSLKKYICVFLKWALNNFRILFIVQHANYSTVPWKDGWSKFHLISKKSMCYYTIVKEVLIHIFFSFFQVCCFWFLFSSKMYFETFKFAILSKLKNGYTDILAKWVSIEVNPITVVKKKDSCTFLT